MHSVPPRDTDLDNQSRIVIGNTVYQLTEQIQWFDPVNGFQVLINTENMTDGTYNLTINFIDQNGVHHYESDEITLTSAEQKKSLVDLIQNNHRALITILLIIIFALMAKLQAGGNQSTGNSKPDEIEQEVKA